MKRGFLKNANKGKSASRSQTETETVVQTSSQLQKVGPAWETNVQRRDLSAMDRNTKMVDIPDGPSHFNLSYGVVEGAGKLVEGFTPPPLQIEQAKEVDHPDYQTVVTTIPILYQDITMHSDAERRDSWCDAILDGATKRHIFSYPGFPQLVPRPPTAVHRIGPAGAKGLGVFATRNIKEGDLILAERPLIMTPLCLPSDVPVPKDFTIEQMSQARMMAWEEHLKFLVDRMLPERRAALMALANGHEHDGSGPIFGRIRTNGIGGGSKWKWKGGQGRNGRYTLVYDEISRLNHSCRPNATHNDVDEASFSKSVVAARDIAAGEEIFISYIDSRKPYAERKKKLAPYGVDCTCAACADHTASDARRAKIVPYVGPSTAELVASQINRYLTQIAILEEEGLESLSEYVHFHLGLVALYMGSGDRAKVAKYSKRTEVLSKRLDNNGTDQDMALLLSMMSNLLRMIDIGFSKLLLLGTFTFVIYYLMKRGFLDSEKAKKAALGVGATGKRVVKISHQALEEKGVCSPNAQYSFNRPTFSARLRAVRHIKAGEEITITYANLDVPCAQRQKELAPYGFTCTCAACKEGAASDARRAKIPSAIDVGTKLSLPELLEVMTLIEREGLEDMPVYLDAMMRITEAYQVQKDWSKCALYAKKVQAFLPMETDGDDDE
ncbi:hypothetical protein BD626DRAFT_586365 [Schizophyllum amplum]|uniref:SET domain-containing protein n=1 Tax=Schizophyllum amplum TaxID=97359 RepID=A0A550C008_9AGAR|nr:hypothetical protein BD626DRAFT_586365 [Auriculariopsis ampla]